MRSKSIDVHRLDSTKWWLYKILHISMSVLSIYAVYTKPEMDDDGFVYIYVIDARDKKIIIMQLQRNREKKNK